MDSSTYKTVEINHVWKISASLLVRSKVNIGVVERHRVSATWWWWVCQEKSIKAGGDRGVGKHMHAWLEPIPVDHHASWKGFGCCWAIHHIKSPHYVVPWTLKRIPLVGRREVLRIRLGDSLSDDLKEMSDVRRTRGWIKPVRSALSRSNEVQNLNPKVLIRPIISLKG